MSQLYHMIIKTCELQTSQRDDDDDIYIVTSYVVFWKLYKKKRNPKYFSILYNKIIIFM